MQRMLSGNELQGGQQLGVAKSAYVGRVTDGLLGIDDIRTAAERVARHVLRTPTVPSPVLSRYLGASVTLKLELLQRTGSFKVRGAFHKLLTLTAKQRAAGVVAVSGGNHGMAVADAAGTLGIAATVVMPEAAPARSVEACRSRGATVRVTPDMPTAFALLDELVAGGATLVHPFDDAVIMAGQGGVGLELAEDARRGDRCAGQHRRRRAHLRSCDGDQGARGRRPSVGVETAGADAMSQALAAGAPVSITPTSIVTSLSAPHVSTLTLAHVEKPVEDVFVVPDAEAVRGVRVLAEEAEVWAEPAAGCLVPAAAQVAERVGPAARLGLVVCGGNVAIRDLAAWS